MSFLTSAALKFSIVISFILIVTFSYSCVESDHPDENLKVLHDKSFPISAGKEFKLDASSGNIEITGWDKNEVHVKILGNKKAEDKVKFSFFNSDERVEIEAKYDWSLFMAVKGVRLQFQIQVPNKFNLECQTAGGNVNTDGVDGNMILKTSGGNLYLANLNGEIAATTSGGQITFTNLAGEMDLTTSGGNIYGDNFSGKLQTSTSGGNINLTGSDTQINASTSGGDISLDYSGQNQGIELETSGGDIMIKIPADFNASVDLSTSGGLVTSEFEGNKAVKVSKSRFEADINNGGNSLTAETSGGNIILKKK